MLPTLSLRGRPVRRTSLLAVVLLTVPTTSPLSAQSISSSANDSLDKRVQFSMHIGAARGMSGFNREAVAGRVGITSHYRVRTSAVWGAALAFAATPQFGVRADVDAVGPVLIDEVSRNATVQGQSVAWLTGLSLTWSPRALCRNTCVTLSAGPGAGFYELAQYMEVATRSFPVSKTQFAYATRAGVSIRAPGRFQQFAFGVTDYMVQFSPVVGSPDLSTLHHAVVSMGWSPP